MGDAVHDIAKWLEACGRTYKGRIFLDNIGIDLAKLAIDDVVLETFGRALGAFTANPDDLRTARFEQAATRAIEAKSLFLNGKPESSATSAMACVVKIDEAFCSYVFDFTDYGGIGAFDGPEEILDLIENANDLTRVLRSGAILRSRLPMVWMTHENILNNTLALHVNERRATAARDELGLLGYNSNDDCLGMFIFPISALAHHVLRRPTSFDASANLVFRSNEQDEPCGRTLNLSTVAPSLPEYVTTPVSLNSDTRFMRLGTVQESSRFSWLELNARTVETRVTSVGTRLMGLG
jgi:hypothetical protein